MPLLSAEFPDLKGRSVFITGGGSGIGAAVSEGFLAQGAKVAFVQRSDASEFCNSMQSKYGSRPLFIRCDVTDIPALTFAIQQARESHGPIQVLVNNAADDSRHQLDGLTVEAWDISLNVEFAPAFFYCPSSRR